MEKSLSTKTDKIKYFDKKFQHYINSYSDFDIKFQKYFINYIISYIHENTSLNLSELKQQLISFPYNFVNSIIKPSIYDFYKDRTEQIIVKDKKLLETHIKSFLEKDRTLSMSKFQNPLSENISDNIQFFIEDSLKHYIFSDYLCISSKLNELRDKYLNGDNDVVFIKELTNILHKYANSDLNKYEYKAIRKFQNNPELISNTLIKKHSKFFSVSDANDISINRNFDNIFFSDDDNKNIEVFINFYILPHFSQDVLFKLYNLIINAPYTANDYICSVIEHLSQNVNINDFPEFFPYKNNLAIRIKKIAEFLDKVNLLEYYNSTNNSRLEKLKIKELQFSKDELFSSLTDLTKMNSYSIEALLGLSAFYANRVTKLAPRLCKGIYILEKLDLYQEIYDNKSFTINDLPCTDSELKEFMAQYDLFINDLQSNLSKEDYELSDDYSEMVEEKHKKLFDKYQDGYENRFPGCYEDDFDFIIKNLDSFVDCLYLLKDESIKTLLYTAIKDNKKNIINWGYISESNRADFNKLLLGFDIQSLNMPIKLHVEKEDLLNFIKSITGKPLIPCYIGDNALNSNIGYVSTQVLTVVPKDKKRDLLKNNSVQSMFINHLKWIQRPLNIPEYYKSKPERYFNLETSELLTMDKDKNEIS